MFLRNTPSYRYNVMFGGIRGLRSMKLISGIKPKRRQVVAIRPITSNSVKPSTSNSITARPRRRRQRVGTLPTRHRQRGVAKRPQKHDIVQKRRRVKKASKTLVKQNLESLVGQVGKQIATTTAKEPVGATTVKKAVKKVVQSLARQAIPTAIENVKQAAVQRLSRKRPAEKDLSVPSAKRQSSLANTASTKSYRGRVIQRGSGTRQSGAGFLF